MVGRNDPGFSGWLSRSVVGQFPHFTAADRGFEAPRHLRRLNTLITLWLIDLDSEIWNLESEIAVGGRKLPKLLHPVSSLSKYFPSVLLFTLAGMAITACSKNSAPPAASTATAPTPANKNIPVIELIANFGYTPGLIQARAGQPAILKVRTKDTTDCSVELRIPVLGIVATLPPTGETTFDIPAQPSGSVIQGACQMGMNHFEIDFN